MQVHDERWVEYFEAQGHSQVEPLGTGMEGAVYRLSDGLVAKVWAEKTPIELTVLQQFYEDLASASLPFATPQIIGVHDADGTSVTYEVELVGRRLQEHLSDLDMFARPAAVECIMTVLDALAATSGLGAAKQLPVLGEANRFYGQEGWRRSLIVLLERRVAAFGDQLRASVPHFDEIHTKVERALVALPTAGESVIHGDICGVNVLVDESLKPLAVLDWGFLSTAGDPMFDAAVAAGIFNMYGPHARAIDLQIAQEVEAAFGYPGQGLLVYRAAYAIATSNAYDVTGQDGHFGWCAATLKRPDVLSALEALSAG